jgi:hypothetical protein
LKRAATLGAAWQGSYIGAEPATSLADYRIAIAKLHELSSGRPPATGARIWWGVHLSGSTEKMVEQVHEWESAGCQDLTIAFGPAAVAIERMKQFADQVMPAFS